ncbi:MAG: hypothetical protein ACJA0V_002483 [Planctomycetota bacterium]
MAECGNLTIWLSPNAIARWNAKPSRRRGGQRKYSDLATETALTLWLLLQLPLRVPKKLGRMDLVIDSSGLAMFGEGEWAAAKHGGKGRRVLGDGAYDSRALYDAAISRGATWVQHPQPHGRT